jgi:ABC-type Fe3+/spermidine/putrescine transport system ATPase subunit
VSAAVRCERLEVHAGPTRLLGPLDLEVARGEHLLLCGPSGCGKTTLLRAVAGLARPTAGRVLLEGRPVSDGPRELVAPQARGIGLLFQGGALWPHMSVARTLEFVLARAGVPRAERAPRRAELLEWVELTGYEARKPGTLSGGEAQRLALARALATRPRLLLLDEPLGPLDAELRGALLERLGRLHDELDLTVIHVTHDPQEASGIADREVRMRAGVIVSS